MLCSGTEHESVVSGGYDYECVDVVLDILVCKICHLPSRDPYLSTCCGHVFCKSCLDMTWGSLTGCPMCRSTQFNVYENKQVDREVKNLKIFCVNKKKDCEWEGELRDIDQHLESCRFCLIQCTNGCGKEVMRQYLGYHNLIGCSYRQVDCQYCKMTGPHQLIVGRHRTECPKFPVSCPNKCKSHKMCREDLKDHKKICPLQMVECEYGCTIKMYRKDKDAHNKNNMEQHLLMTVENLKATRECLMERINTLEALMLAQKFGSGRRGNICPLSLSGNSKWAIHLHLASVAASGDDNLTAPVIKKMAGYSIMVENDRSWFSGYFYTHEMGYKMFLLVTANTTSTGNDTDSDDDFYATETHLSLQTDLAKGPYDDKLSWPMRDTLTVSILNQQSDEDHYTKVITFSGGEDGKRVRSDHGASTKVTANFVSTDVLETPRHHYIKDDCVYFKINYMYQQHLCAD